jgi:Zn-dependent protease
VYVQDNAPQAIILIAFFLLLAFPVHEFAHAWTAYRLGDSTAKLFGKLTLNPVAHFDQVGGTILVISILVTGFPFGFAQTPVNPRNLRGRHGDAIVAAAGPVSNLLQLIVFLSIILGLFNLIPIPPLDGGAILLSFLPPRTVWQVRPFLAQYGFFLLILLIIPLSGQSILGRVLLPIADAVYGVLVG